MKENSRIQSILNKAFEQIVKQAKSENLNYIEYESKNISLEKPTERNHQLLKNVY